MLRSEMDPLRGFIDDYCVLGGELRKAYETWAQESGESELLRGKKWGEKLRAYGCEPTMDPSTGKKRVWKGIALRNGGPEGPDTRRNPTESIGVENTRKSRKTGETPDGTDKKIRKPPSENPRVGGFTKNLSESVGSGDSVGSTDAGPDNADHDPVCKKHHARDCGPCYRELNDLIDQGTKPGFAMEDVFLQQ